ncbi:sesquipedalian-1-like [Leptinotarsa decemlineata]|uniref:sesquipedalian-1 n=1 Tax=Leptinotarsa decemlineata TaxID=7539 RepID=UPI000C2554EB|nr:sesquipedalian-1-like [Leptinotarsa decemlineata]XP_023022679.1 sesquipedalian-1-like [Leptinotarsa decemlineata]
MKINEKNLCSFAVSATPVDKEGYLNKRGEVNKNFQRRYFLLKGNLLFYFDKKGDREPVGVIILEGCSIELAEDDEQFSFKIEFHGINNRSYVLGAESQESMEQWMKALACAGYDYMKLMVAELQRQLDDIEETPLPLPSSQVMSSPVPPPRTRHNPFNKPEINPHQRSNSLRSTCSNSSRLDETRYSENNLAVAATPKISISFRELHNSYGRPILKDFNYWKHERKEKSETVENLISF